MVSRGVIDVRHPGVVVIVAVVARRATVPAVAMVCHGARDEFRVLAVVLASSVGEEDPEDGEQDEDGDGDYEDGGAGT